MNLIEVLKEHMREDHMLNLLTKCFNYVYNSLESNRTLFKHSAVRNLETSSFFDYVLKRMADLIETLRFRVNNDEKFVIMLTDQNNYFHKENLNQMMSLHQFSHVKDLQDAIEKTHSMTVSKLASLPDKYVDPLVGELMRDPVLLPSGTNLNRSTIGGIVNRKALKNERL